MYLNRTSGIKEKQAHWCILVFICLIPIPLLSNAFALEEHLLSFPLRIQSAQSRTQGNVAKPYYLKLDLEPLRLAA